MVIPKSQHRTRMWYIIYKMSGYKYESFYNDKIQMNSLYRVENVFYYYCFNSCGVLFQWRGGLSSNHVILRLVHRAEHQQSSQCDAAQLLRQRALPQGSSVCSGKSLQSLVDTWQANSLISRTQCRCSEERVESPDYRHTCLRI
ncbi:Hypothetical_protein [Hexamita inflata]|uniref:Hypothetical_protein n=1 Tax=Hexamita inflata TaxID=28002 RepID=A0AA86QNC8_9EUKA|nr:Hypothetical protein HINF_LOCUS47472 [Hexamita inflata]